MFLLHFGTIRSRFNHVEDQNFDFHDFLTFQVLKSVFLHTPNYFKTNQEKSGIIFEKHFGKINHPKF